MGSGGLGRDCRDKGILTQIKNYFDRNRLGELLVVRGIISAKDLRTALSLQKATTLPLGEIFVAQRVISRNQLRVLLARQAMLRALATMLVLLMCGGASKRSLAGDSAPIQVAMASVGSGAYSKVASYPSLLGTAEKKSTNLGAFTKWMGMFSRYQTEMGNASYSGTARQWRENLESFRGLPLMTMAQRVNDLVNSKPYILDNRNWGKSDYWETPLEFMAKGGDCEDFAIAKYVALMQLGVPEERLRLAIVQDTYKNIPHAVLALYTDDGVYVLDQQIKTIQAGGHEGRYKPIFSINREAWWLHTAPSSTEVASR